MLNHEAGDDRRWPWWGKDLKKEELIPRIYKELLWVCGKIIDNPTQKGAEDLNRQFSKADLQMAN